MCARRAEKKSGVVRWIYKTSSLDRLAPSRKRRCKFLSNALHSVRRCVRAHHLTLDGWIAPYDPFLPSWASVPNGATPESAAPIIQRLPCLPPGYSLCNNSNFGGYRVTIASLQFVPMFLQSGFLLHQLFR